MKDSVTATALLWCLWHTVDVWSAGDMRALRAKSTQHSQHDSNGLNCMQQTAGRSVSDTMLRQETRQQQGRRQGVKLQQGQWGIGTAVADCSRIGTVAAAGKREQGLGPGAR